MHAPRIAARSTRAFVLVLAATTLLFTAAQADTVTEWNSVWLDCVRATGGPPCPIARAGAMVHAAVFEAVNSVHPRYGAYLATIPATPDASAEAAAAAAAHDVLVALYPGRQGVLDAALVTSLGRIPEGASKAAGVQVGQQAALQIIQARQSDGSDDATPYTIGTGPGEWRPTYPDYTSPPFTPNWGLVTPWVIQSGVQFRPPGPLGSTNLQSILVDPKYSKMFREAKELGAKNSKKRTAYETQTAYFWANDVDGTYKPPGHLNHIAQVLSAQRHLSLEENARLFALLNLALGDAGIVAWDCKYQTRVDFWRPITGIREADTDGNPLTVADPTWEPLNAFTPPFPAYISGHATFSATAAAIFRKYFGTDRVTYTISTDEPLYTGAPRTYRTFSEAALENAQSRIYLGVHWQFDADDGNAAGTALGEYVYAHALLPLSESRLLASEAPTGTKLPVAGTAGDVVGEIFVGETRLSIPSGASLAFEGLKPNPASGDLVASFSLPDAGPAVLELFDIAGRRILSRQVGALGAGNHLLKLNPERPVASGLYFLRLTKNEKSIVARASILR